MSRTAEATPSALFFVSAAILLQEIYWLRAFAETEWGHVASMVVSTAMLGIGAGGTFVLIRGERAIRFAARDQIALLLAFTVLTGAAPAAVNHLPLEPMLLVWRPSTWLWLTLREMVVATPIAAGAAVIALAFRTCPESPGRVYAVNLFGSGAGVLAALWLMATRPTGDLHLASVLAGALATACAWRLTGLPRLVLVACGLAGLVAVRPLGAPTLSPTKDLALALRLPTTRVLADEPGTAGRWTVVESPALRFAPGLSLTLSEPLPAERSFFLRGDRVGAVWEADQTNALRHRVAWLPFAIRSPRSVMVLGETALLDLQAALLAGAPRIVGVIPDPRIRRSLRGSLSTFSGIAPPRVEIRGDGVRASLARAGGARGFDLVILPPSDSLSSASAGLTAAAETYSLTIEGIEAAFSVVSPEGQLAIQRWTQAPPRDLPRLLATVSAVLERAGIREVRAHLALVQGWDAWTLSVSRRPWSPRERALLDQFANDHGFDIVIPAKPGPRFHELPGGDRGPLLDAVLSREGAIPADYPFQIEPVTDDRPYFHHFLSYRRLPAYLRALREGALPPSEWGDFFLWAGLLSAVSLGAVVIAAPALLASGPRQVLLGSGLDTALLGSIGFGYMLLEILFIQQGARLFGVTSPSAAIVLAAFLLASGIGAATFERFGRSRFAGAGASFTATLLAILAAVGLGPLFDHALWLPNPWRWVVLFGSAFLVALPLGIPFPASLRLNAPGRIPWLVAVNGWASVVGAVAATLIAVSEGFRVLGITAAALYAIATGLLMRPGDARRTEPRAGIKARGRLRSR